MASTAEQFASSISLANFQKATELKKRLWFTIGALILFRLLSFVPVPGIDPVAMQALYQTQSGGILDVSNTFSGGALSRFSIVALGVMPYITASIVVQLGATLYGPWQTLRKEGETRRKKLNQYTRYLTVAIKLLQGMLAVRGLEAQSIRQGISAVVIPPIFASSLLLMPLTVLQWAGSRASAGGGTSDWLITMSTFLQHGSAPYELLYAAGIIFFTFFYTAVQFNSEETADNLKRHGGFIPGIRPGKATEQYFDYLLNRITVVGAAYLAFICLVPDIAAGSAGLTNLRLGGTSLLIVVNVTMDTVSQIQSHLIAHQYGAIIKKAKLKTAPRRHCS